MPAQDRTTVALAGATGNLGLPVLQALLRRYYVVALSRIGGNSAKLPPHPNLIIREVDFTSAASIEPILSEHNVEVVVSCLATLAIGAQNPLIDASVKAGVSRFIPAEFGMDSLNPLCARLPVCVPKIQTAEYLQSLSRKHPGFSWTGIANGLFLDWGMREGLIVDPKNHSATLYNGGDVPFSATTLAHVAQAVVGVIQNQSDTANRLLYVQSIATTQNQLIAYAKEVDGKDWENSNMQTADVLRESLQVLETGDDEMTAMNGFCVVAMWHAAYGGDFSGHLDNQLLAVPPLREAEVKELVAGCLLGL